MILSCKGFNIGDYRIPAFDLNEGEMIGLCLYGGSHFYDLEKRLIEIFSGDKKCEEVKVFHPMQFVKHVHERSILDRFLINRTEQYITKKAGGNVEIAKKIYEIDHVLPQTRLRDLSNNSKKWLSLFTTLSRTNKVLFDLLGQDPVGAEKTLEYIAEYIGLNGGAILLDNADDPHKLFSKYLRIKL